jgi:hypothetical protein
LTLSELPDVKVLGGNEAKGESLRFERLLEDGEDDAEATSRRSVFVIVRAR